MKRLKVLSTSAFLIASILLTSPKYYMEENVKEEDKSTDDYTYEYVDESCDNEAIIEVESPAIEQANEPTIEVLPTPVVDKYDFAYVTKDSAIYDSYLNKIDSITKYQKVLVLKDAGGYSKIEYGDASLKSGFISNDNIKRLPNTFIEIDLSDQKISMYIDDKKVLESVIVSGRGDKYPTSEGSFDIFAMERNTYLKGYNPDGSLQYSSYVDYWMPFNGGVGLHDAEYHTHSDGFNHGWRDASTFGGTTYEYNGSHGCINLLNDTAKTIYENAYIGEKVLVHK